MVSSVEWSTVSVAKHKSSRTKPGCNHAFHYFKDEGEIRDWSTGYQMIKVQSTFLQPSKYECLLLSGWKNDTTSCTATSSVDNTWNRLPDTDIEALVPASVSHHCLVLSLRNCIQRELQYRNYCW